MKGRIEKLVAAVKKPLLAGDAEAAAAALDTMLGQLGNAVPDAEGRAALEAGLAELRALAAAMQQGAQEAINEVRAAIQAAQSLQTYDRTGRRLTAPVRAPLPRRY